VSPVVVDVGFVLPLSWNPEGVAFELLRGELEDVVCIQVEHQPYENDDGKRNKARTVVDCGEKGQQKNPKGHIISQPDQSEWVSVCLFDGKVVICVFPKPREPRCCMKLDNDSVKRPDKRKHDQSTPLRPGRGGIGVDNKYQTGKSQR
jgi:hypothetical protein